MKEGIFPNRFDFAGGRHPTLDTSSRSGKKLDDDF